MYQETKLFGSRLCYLPVEAGRVVQLDGISQPGRVNEDGLFIPGTDGRWVNVRMLQVGSNQNYLCYFLILKNEHLIIVFRGIYWFYVMFLPLFGVATWVIMIHR